MTNILIRDLDPALVDRLKNRARRNQRSLQAELRDILEREGRRGLSQEDVDAFNRHTAAIRARAGPQRTNSTDIIRRERDDPSR